MKKRLLSNLSEESKEGLRTSFKASSLYRSQLEKVLNEDINHIVEDMLKDEDQTDKDWALKQAQRIAEIKSMKKLLTFLK